MLYKSTVFVLVILFCGFIQAQDQNRISKQTSPKVVFTGDEVKSDGGIIIEAKDPLISDSYMSGGFLWDMTLISVNPTAYDLQSNSSAQQLWCDINNPDYLHVVYTYSAGPTTFGDRVVIYYGSPDAGTTWYELGPVPVNTGTQGRSGYGTVSGTSDGRAVIMSHPEYPQGSPRSVVFIDDAAFAYVFSSWDSYVLSPGYNNGNPPIWPRLVVDGDDNVIFGASQSTNYGTADSMYVNVFDYTTQMFQGWQTYQGDQAETYPLEIPASGAFVGQVYLAEALTPEEGDVFYRESTDGGLTWSARQTVYTHTSVNDTGYGAIRGVALNYYGDEPCIAFEDAWQDFAAGQYRQGDYNTLWFWSPNVNGGDPVALVDSSWANWNPGGGANDVYLGVSRPVLSRSEEGDYLFLAFSAATAVIDSSNDLSPFFDLYFMYSMDGGNTWSDPERINPVATPGEEIDWRWHSIARVTPVVDGMAKVHIICEADPIAGSQIQGSASGTTANYYHFTTDIPIVGVEDNIIANNFTLEQNYPNPFNPSTTINYTLAERSAVTLKVYDVLGNEVATLVNSTKEAGKHNVNFNASGLSSGLYIYTINTGNFTSSKKMMLLK